MTSCFRLLILIAITAVVSASEPVLRVMAPGKTITFSSEEFAALPHSEVAVREPHGEKERVYSGVPMRELLLRVEAPLGDKLRGAALQLVVLVRSRDGYAVAFALADFDEAFSSRTLLLAEKQDGQPLPENASPLRLIVPGDKKAARSARMVASIEIMPAGLVSKP